MKKSLLLGAFLAAGSMGLADLSFGHGGTYRGAWRHGAPRRRCAWPRRRRAPARRPQRSVVPWPDDSRHPRAGDPRPDPVDPDPDRAGLPAGRRRRAGPFDLGLLAGFNKEPYLNLRNKVRSIGVQSGSDEAFLGLGEQKKTADSLRPGEELIRATVVLALKKALETEEQNDIVTGCLIALAKIGDVKNEDGTSEFVDIIQSFLAAEEQEISETAALALGILADDRSVLGLVGLMLDNTSAAP